MNGWQRESAASRYLLLLNWLLLADGAIVRRTQFGGIDECDDLLGIAQRGPCLIVQFLLRDHQDVFLIVL